MNETTRLAKQSQVVVAVQRLGKHELHCDLTCLQDHKPKGWSDFWHMNLPGCWCHAFKIPRELRSNIPCLRLHRSCYSQQTPTDDTTTPQQLMISSFAANRALSVVGKLTCWDKVPNDVKVWWNWNITSETNIRVWRACKISQCRRAIQFRADFATTHRAHFLISNIKMSPNLMK